MKDSVMPQFDIRPAVRTDHAVILDLCRATFLPEDTVDIEGLDRYLWTDHSGSEHVRLVAESSGSVIGLAVGHHVTTDNETAGHLGLVVVDEAWQWGGVGTALLTKVEALFVSVGASEVWAGATQPYFWWPGVDLRYSSALAMLRSRGYETDDEVANMGVELRSADLTTPTLDGVDVHRLRPDEFAEFETWMRQTWEDEWAREITQTMQREPVSCWVAVSGSTFVGFAGYDTNRRGWFGPMGSTESIRGRGLGRVLLRHCLQDMADRGDDTCEICWIGPEKFYSDAVRATIGRRFLQLRKELNK